MCVCMCVYIYIYIYIYITFSISSRHFFFRIDAGRCCFNTIVDTNTLTTHTHTYNIFDFFQAFFLPNRCRPLLLQHDRGHCGMFCMHRSHAEFDMPQELHVRICRCGSDRSVLFCVCALLLFISRCDCARSDLFVCTTTGIQLLCIR